MPELPEVETVCQGLAPAMVGHAFARVEQRREDLRFPLPARFARRLTGRTVTDLSRRAKYLLAQLDDGSVLLMHLGMSGRFMVADGQDVHRPGRFHNQVGAAHEHIVFHMDGGARIGYADPRRFGFMDLIGPDQRETSRFLAGLGPEPLDPTFDASLLNAALLNKRTSIKAALLDQRIVAGLGNIYVCEALYRARISPRRVAATLAGFKGPAKRLNALVDAIKEVLTDAIAAGGSSLRDYAAADGSLGYFQTTFSVYDREGAPCARAGCGAAIRRFVQSGRSTFYCPGCQR